MKNKLLNLTVLVALVISTYPGLVGISGAQNKKENTMLDGKASEVRIQKEEGPSGHSTIGIVENEIERDADEILALTFSRLMIWQYDVDNNTPAPQNVVRLDGRKVNITGFMYPLQQGDSIQYFCLLRTTQTCCYGPRPQFNQYVLVEMDTPTPFYRLEPVSCTGKFKVEPTPDEGFIYRIEGEKCESISRKNSK